MKNTLRGICTRSPDTPLQIVTVEEVLVLLTICIRRFLKTACGQKWFSYRGAKLWNDLNREIMIAQLLNHFKSSLKMTDLDNEHSLTFPFAFIIKQLYLVFFLIFIIIIVDL